MVIVSCEECVNVEVQSLDRYISESDEWMLKFGAGEKGLSEVEDPDARTGALQLTQMSLNFKTSC